MARKFYLSFKVRQALNVAQAVVCYQANYGHDNVPDAGIPQIMSVKEGKKDIVFHFERGIEISVSLIRERSSRQQVWLVKEVSVKFKSLLRTLLIDLPPLSGGELIKLKKNRDWGNPEVVTEALK